MTTQARRGRPSKPFTTSWGETVAGLRRERDGRWRIVATRETYVEPDERLAVLRFRQWQDRQTDATVKMPLPAFDSLHDFHRALDNPATEMTVTVAPDALPQASFTVKVQSAAFWAEVRRLLIEDVQLVAEMTGLPKLITWATYNNPTPPIKLAQLLQVYEDNSHAVPDTIREWSKTFHRFLAMTGAETLDELTVPILKAFRDAMNETKSSTTAAAYFTRVRHIIAFGKTQGEDSGQIDTALSRMSILKAKPVKQTKQPTPIQPEHFLNLLSNAAARLPEWYDRLLLALNCCLHLDETLSVQWDELELERGTFVTHRSKTGVVRAATLWPQTIAALSRRPRKGPFVFTSKQGTRFNAKGQWKTWEKLRTAAGCPDVQFDDIRDGAYTAAANAGGVDEKHARLFAGHKSHGLQDNYVQRNPAVAAPACAAVFQHYFRPTTN